MIASLIITSIAAAACIAFATSALCGVSMGLLRPALQRLAPAAQARVLLSVALLPLFACSVVMIAALSPSFGWIADHCGPFGDPHPQTHPHLCEHHVAAWPALPLLALGALLLARIAIATLAQTWAAATCVWLDRKLAASAQSSAQVGAQAGARVLPFEAPQAFVVGLLRPSLYVTQGLLSEAHREHLDAVLAHERAHVRRADALRMFVARLGLSFHLPGIARALSRRLLCAHEMAADAEAAVTVGSRERIASALLQLARAQPRLPHIALAFGASDLETRVRGLLDGAPRCDLPRSSTLLLVAAFVGAVVAMNADSVHHGLEQALGLLGG